MFENRVIKIIFFFQGSAPPKKNPPLLADPRYTPAPTPFGGQYLLSTVNQLNTYLKYFIMTSGVQFLMKTQQFM